MKALMEFPQQMQKWRDTPDLDMSATKELMRWTSPVRHMVRTATDDLELRGKKIKAGDNVALWFPAANRDESVIANANQLDLERDGKLHLAFGHGSHMCLGQHLATQETAIFFRELLPRLKHIELAGEPEWVRAIFVGGLKSMPVKYQMG
jgi:cytochrome P450